MTRRPYAAAVALAVVALAGCNKQGGSSALFGAANAPAAPSAHVHENGGGVMGTGPAEPMTALPTDTPLVPTTAAAPTSEPWTPEPTDVGPGGTVLIREPDLSLTIKGKLIEKVYGSGVEYVLSGLDPTATAPGVIASIEKQGWKKVGSSNVSAGKSRWTGVRHDDVVDVIVDQGAGTLTVKTTT